jgi:hypothetical protein
MSFSLIAILLIGVVGIGVIGLLFWGIWALLLRADRDKDGDN